LPRSLFDRTEHPNPFIWVKIEGMKQQPHILLVHPWITDFAAYNFWVKPLGLLSIGSLLRAHGLRVSLIDCLDEPATSKPYGDGKFKRTIIEKPKPLRFFPRHYSRYGISEEAFQERLRSVGKPDLVAITSGMTYWYPGLFAVVERVKDTFGAVPVVLGGIYATLCEDHAKRYSGADLVFKGGEILGALRTICGLLDVDSLPSVHGTTDPLMEGLFFPAFDLYPQLSYVCIATSKGCPLRCTYCASHLLSKGYVRRQPDRVIEEIRYWVLHHGVRNFAFYDDALLLDSENHMIPILKELIRENLGCYFHAPNGLHIREIHEELAQLLYQGGFKTIRLGFETSIEATQLQTGGKVGNDDLRRAVKYLTQAGYRDEEIGVYIMAGLPGQRAEEVEASVAFVREIGARPMLVEYSPIPGTPLFEQAKRVSPFDLENEPLFHNNSILPCAWEGFTLDDYKRIKSALRKRY